MTFRLFYALVALIIFAIEVCIALFVRDAFIRPYVGDVLAVALVYTALRAITPLRLWPAIAVTLAIALAIELAQLFNLLDALGLRVNRIAATVLGGSFDWLDLVAYGLGALAVAVVELMRPKR
jgi:Protein of unknown function (DUF2809)